MKKKSLLLLIVSLTGLCLMCSTSNLIAQGIGINSSGNPADNTAGLDVNFNNKGLLIPRLTTAQRDAITNPAAGLIIYNTDCNALNYNAGTPSSPNWATLNSTTVTNAGVTISSNPAGAICSGASVTFTAVPSNGLISPSYQWKVNGTNVGTNNPVYITTTLNNGDVVACVLSVTSPCVTGSPATSNALTMLVNASPAITGTTPGSVCGTGPVTLGATASAGIINWYDQPAGGILLGTGTSFTTPSISSTTSYYAEATSNGCTSASRTGVTATVYSGTPAQPGTISGPASNLGGITSAPYSITPVANAAAYSWTVPGGATITSGQGTTSITVSFGCSASGSISVVATNACGSSSAQTINVSTALDVPGAIIGDTLVCPNSVTPYSISPVPFANSYTWTVPASASIVIGQGTSSISVNSGNITSAGTITVTQTSNCGTSTAKSRAIYNAASTFSWGPSGTIVGGMLVTFSPTSTFTGAIYSWTFQGGSPSTSTAQSPVVSWPAQSSSTSFNVTLNVNGCSSPTTNPILISSQGVAFAATSTGKTGSIQNFTIPSGVSSATIKAYGAPGGNQTSGASGGLGAFMSGIFSVSPGNVLNILVGQKGSSAINPNWGGGGGGGTFVVRSGTLLIAASGGGGGGCVNGNINGTTSSTAQNGGDAGSGASPGTGGSGGNGGSGGSFGANGGGYSTDGTTSPVGGKSYLNGGAGGSAGSAGNGGDGGYGGGAGGGGTSAGTTGGGGGGGYSGGGGGGCCCPAAGGGGGSFNNGSSQSNASGVSTFGQVIITW